jgi:capsular polysaccharide biosynthesis protein
MSTEPLSRPTLRWTTARVLAVAVLVLAFSGAGAAVAAARSPLYQSSSAIVLQQQALLSSNGIGVVIKLNQLRLHYVDLIDSDGVTGPAARSLGLTRRQVANRVTVTAPNESLVFYPTASADSRREAQRIASAITDALVAFATAEQTSAPIPSKDRVVLAVVDPAGVGRKVEPTTSGIVVSGGFGAAAALVTLAGLAQVPAIRRRLT